MLATFARQFDQSSNAVLWPSVTVTPVSEAYTTKTCTRCGHENDVGAARHVVSSLRLRVDRDIAGARNITEVSDTLFGV
jgi:transposase